MNGREQFLLIEIVVVFLHKIITDLTRVMVLLALVW